MPDCSGSSDVRGQPPAVGRDARPQPDRRGGRRSPSGTAGAVEPSELRDGAAEPLLVDEGLVGGHGGDDASPTWSAARAPARRAGRALLRGRASRGSGAGRRARAPARRGPSRAGHTGRLALDFMRSARDSVLIPGFRRRPRSRRCRALKREADVEEMRAVGKEMREAVADLRASSSVTATASPPRRGDALDAAPIGSRTG